MPEEIKVYTSSNEGCLSFVAAIWLIWNFRAVGELVHWLVEALKAYVAGGGQ